MSCTASPVTQTAEVEVKSAWENGVQTRFAAESGSISTRAPSRITPAKPKIMI